MNEHNHQVALFQWANLHTRKYPALDMLFAVPNAGKRTPRQGAWMKAEGLRAGVPDILLDAPSHAFNGLRIELKLPKVGKKVKGRLSDAQRVWLDRLNAHGYKAVVCYGWQEAVAVIEEYLQ